MFERHSQVLSVATGFTMYLSIAFIASLVASVTAHATFQEMWVNGVDQGNFCVRLPQSNSPVTDVTSDVNIEHIYLQMLKSKLTIEFL